MVPLRSRQFQAHSQQNVLHIFDKFCCNALSFIHFIIISRPGQSSFLSSCRNGQRRSIGSGSSSYKAGRNTKQARHNNTAHCIGGQQGGLSLQLIQILPGFPLAPHPQVTLRFHQHRQPAPTAMSLGRCWCCLHTGSQAGAGQALGTGISAAVVVLWFWLHAECYDVVM